MPFVNPGIYGGGGGGGGDIVVVDSNSIDLTKAGDQLKADVVVADTDTVDLEIGLLGITAEVKKIDGGDF